MISTLAEPSGAIVFVHGWGGKSVSTWDRFVEHARRFVGYSKYDLFFFGYPSKGPTTKFCAGRFASFLEDLLARPQECIVGPTLEPWTPFITPRTDYSRVLLCAHSMGAVVVRRAIADLDLEPVAPQLPRVRLLLFAPAHLGSSDLPGLIAEGLGELPGLKLVGYALRAYYRSVKDLAEKSPALELLEKDTRDRLAARRDAHLPVGHLIAAVLHSQHDKVVVQERFVEDLRAEDVMHQDHRSICKPNDVYLTPVDRVLRAL
jgi:pimeloyl-ACP methyl ester carboxylesterase